MEVIEPTVGVAEAKVIEFIDECFGCLGISEQDCVCEHPPKVETRCNVDVFGGKGSPEFTMNSEE